jgi:pimeloyl-ACP methyl ester carboxylesterase
MKAALVVLVLVVLIVVALAGNTYWVDSRTRGAAARDGGAIVGTPVVPANVEVRGSGPAIVLIHGFGAAIDWWDEIAPTLATDHRIVRIDLIGHGGTEAPASGYSIERQGELVAAVLDRLGVDRVTVIGHSMGGEVATAFAAIKPERIERIILIDTPPTVETTFTIMAQAAFTPVIGELLSHFQTDETLRRGLRSGLRGAGEVRRRHQAAHLHGFPVRSQREHRLSHDKADLRADRGAPPGAAAARAVRNRGCDRPAGSRENLRARTRRQGRDDRRLRPFADGRETGEDPGADQGLPAAQVLSRQGPDTLKS